MGPSKHPIKNSYLYRPFEVDLGAEKPSQQNVKKVSSTLAFFTLWCTFRLALINQLSLSPSIAQHVACMPYVNLGHINCICSSGVESSKHGATRLNAKRILRVNLLIAGYSSYDDVDVIYDL